MTNLNILKQQLRSVLFLITLITPVILSAQKTVAITQIIEHPSLNSIREGLIEGLKKEGFEEGKNITIIYESAHGNPTTAVQIAQKFAGMKLDAIIPISTPSAQAIVQHVKKTPVVFAAISDPLGAKIVSSLKHPGGNVTGVADTPPLKEQLAFILTCLPGLKTLGVVYNPGEANNVTFLEALKPLLKENKITLLTAAAPKSSDVKMAAQSLVGRVDAIFVGNDNTVISGVEALAMVCLEAKKPLFVSDPESVDRGALAAYAYDQKQIGLQVAEMVVEVLNGKNPGEISVERAQGLKHSINSKVAEKLQITCAYTH
jgi:putative ABC transport system substrate-binding protein